MKNPARDIADEHLQAWGEHERAIGLINGYPPMSPEARARDGGTISPPCSRIPRGLHGALGRSADPRASKIAQIMAWMRQSPDPEIIRQCSALYAHYVHQHRGTKACQAARVKGERQFRELLAQGRSYIAEKLRDDHRKALDKAPFLR